MKPVDMTRPVPAAPSPGSSAARQKLTPGDRRRIAESIKRRFEGKEPKPQRVGLQYRFTRGDEEWAILKDGSYWCFRAGPFEYGTIVTPKIAPYAGRQGVVTAIVPLWANQVTICVWFSRTTRHVYDKESGQWIEFSTRPGPFYSRDELEILGHIHKPA